MTAWLSGALPTLPEAPGSRAMATFLAKRQGQCPLFLEPRLLSTWSPWDHTLGLAVGVSSGRTGNFLLISALVLGGQGTRGRRPSPVSPKPPAHDFEGCSAVWKPLPPAYILFLAQPGLPVLGTQGWAPGDPKCPGRSPTPSPPRKKLSNFLHTQQWTRASNYVAKRYIESVSRDVYFEDVRLQMEAKLWGEEYNRHKPPKQVCGTLPATCSGDSIGRRVTGSLLHRRHSR